MLRTILMALFFTAVWCAPCKIATPRILYLMLEGEDIQLIDIDKHVEIAKKHGVTTVPTLIVNGKHHVGVKTIDEYRELVNQ